MQPSRSLNQSRWAHAAGGLVCLLAPLGSTGNASAQSLMFTIRTHLTAPVMISAPSASKLTGFDVVTLHNESKKTVESVRLEVKSTSASGEEITLEGADFLVTLAPGERKRVRVGMGRVSELSARAKAERSRVARAILVVAAARYADGSEWRSDDPVIDDRLRQ